MKEPRGHCEQLCILVPHFSFHISKRRRNRFMLECLNVDVIFSLHVESRPTGSHRRLAASTYSAKDAGLV